MLGELPPDVTLDDHGVCGHCKAHHRAPVQPGQAGLLESDFVRLLKRHRGRGAYDCLVMCSGGKDSVAALFFMVERFKARPLVFTFDQGFGNPEGLENVRRATSRLGVDWLYLRSEYMKGFFAEIVKTRAPVPMCPPCSLWYMQVTCELAARYDIPLLITGWTRGQLDHPSGKQAALREEQFPTIGAATQAFIRDLRRRAPRYESFPLSMEEIRRRHKKRMILSPHWFLPFQEAEYVDTLREHLGWQPVERSWPAFSTNCRLNYLAAWLSMRDYGFTHHHIEMSQLIRLGEVSRAEAVQALGIDINQEPARGEILRVLDELGLTLDDLGDLEQPWIS
ncbi:MAG: hypothetical protein ABIO70_19235 [Pseudomonadota bacterium]